MNKFLLFGASFALVTIPAYASGFSEVTRLVSKSDLNKEAFAKKYKADPHRVVSRVSGATVTLPWTENFDDESSFDNFTVIDAKKISQAGNMLKVKPNIAVCLLSMMLMTG